MRHHQDPLPGLGPALACALAAQIVNVLLAAVFAAQVPGGYRVRSWVFLAGLLWSVAGTALLLIRTAARADGRGVRLGRIALWVVSIWLWPILMRRSDSRSQPG